ncbi:hypothetical protein KUTeg_014575 [Tegillarca granosa]|uniref:Integrase catalytic domain-containing protein n=1 Tax=Tegillarca granosa TaxID=220873 RepID=A0ABQ9ES67_TEGGR|nr:hypothetical protein KUTeg_014575 [Tegillarca granosa]
MLTAEEQDYLKSIWTDPKHAGSFAGPEKLYKIVHREGKFNIGLRRIRQFLSDQDAYSLQKRVQRKFPRNHIVAEGIDSQWDCDLMDVKNLIKWNKNVQYILVAQDVFSRYVFAEPMKQKKGIDTVKALDKLFASGRKPKLLRVDKGSEFKNKWVKEYLKEQSVHLISTQNETKSNFAERSIQNIKNRLYRMFTERQSYKYLTELPQIIESINNTPSRPLKGNWHVSLLELTYQGVAKPPESDVYVCSNLCGDTLVGDTELPLLRRLLIGKKTENIIFNRPYGVPLKTGTFHDVRLYIRTS